jgi:hypothetical protein
MPHVVLVLMLDLAQTVRAALFGPITVNRDKDRDHEKSGKTPQAHSVQLLRKAEAILRARIVVDNGCG